MALSVPFNIAHRTTTWRSDLLGSCDNGPSLQSVPSDSGFRHQHLFLSMRVETCSVFTALWITRRNNKTPNHDSQAASDDDDVEDAEDAARHSPTVFSEYSANDEDGGRSGLRPSVSRSPSLFRDVWLPHLFSGLCTASLLCRHRAQCGRNVRIH